MDRYEASDDIKRKMGNIMRQKEVTATAKSMAKTLGVCQKYVAGIEKLT